VVRKVQIEIFDDIPNTIELARKSTPKMDDKWEKCKQCTTRNLAFCNCLMQLVFSCMQHMQLEIHPVA